MNWQKIGSDGHSYSMQYEKIYITQSVYSEQWLSVIETIKTVVYRVMHVNFVQNKSLIVIFVEIGIKLKGIQIYISSLLVISLWPHSLDDLNKYIF